jgi:hypothetical protein
MSERSVDELADELIAIYSGFAPVSQWRRPNAGQRCAKCGGVCGPRAITNGTQFWHPGCTAFTSLSDVNSSSQLHSLTHQNQIQSEQLQDSSVGGDSTSVASKMNREERASANSSVRGSWPRSARRSKPSIRRNRRRLLSPSASRRSLSGRLDVVVPLRQLARSGDKVSTVSRWRARAKEIIARTTGHLPREERVKLVRAQQEWVEARIERAWRTGDKELGDYSLDVLEIKLRSAVEALGKDQHTNGH